MALLAETAAKYRRNATVTRPDVVRKLQLVSFAGEALLPEPQRDQIVNLTVQVEEVTRTGRVSCNENCSLDLAGVEARLAEHRDPGELAQLWRDWHGLFAPLHQDFLSVLGLAADIATENETPGVEGYWLALAEYPGSYDDARALWRQVEPLYLKLQRYVRAKLEERYGRDAMGNSSAIPPYLLGSLGASDWTNVAEVVLGEDFAVYGTLQKNLKEQDVGGRKSYELADKLVQSMGFEELGKGFWEESRFNATCHSRAVEFCSSGRTRVITCNRTAWAQYMEAHEIVMRAVRRQVIIQQQYTFMNPNHQSAAHEAVVGLLPLVAATPASLQRTGLLPAGEGDLVPLRLLVALRILPRLPAHLAADLWRLELLSSGDNATVQEAAGLWGRYRQNFSRVGAPKNHSEWDLELDELTTTNRPYLAKFAGTFLQFQMLELFENKTVNGSTLVKVIQEGDQLKQLLKDGLSAEWPQLLRADLGIDRVDAAALLRYFKPLENYLDAREDAATRPGNRGMAGTVANLPDGNATDWVSEADRRASGIGSGILIGCVTVALVGIVATVFLMARRRFQRSRSDYQLAKTSPE
ncbi:angiotensin-converting enzyme-like isoform X2 [Bacillus rossius redtenbacheri]